MMHLVSLSDAMSTCWSSTDVFLAADFVFRKVKLQQHVYCMKLMLYYCFRLGLGAHSPIGLLGHRDGPLHPCRAPISISNSCFTKQSPERLKTLMGMTLRVIHLSTALARSPPQHLSLPHSGWWWLSARPLPGTLYLGQHPTITSIIIWSHAAALATITTSLFFNPDIAATTL